MRWWRSVVVAALVPAWLLPLQAAEPAYRFVLPGGPPPVSLSPAVLSPEERAFLAGLPEIRVGLQRSGAPPFERVAADGAISGVQPELLSTLARTFGLRIRPVVLPDWPSVLQAAREGRVDMVLTAAVSAERLQYLAFTLGTVSKPTGVLALRSRAALVIDNARIALERGYYSNDVVGRRFPAATVVPADNTVEALRMVSDGRADAYVGSLLEAVDLLSRQPMPGIEVRQILSSGTGYYHFGVRKDWVRLVTILNKGITSWRAVAELPGAADLMAAAASVPGGLQLHNAMALSPEEAAVLSEHSVWRVGAVRGLPLLNAIDGNGAHSGIAADYTEQVARRLGVGVELVPFDNVGEMIDALRAGRIDLAPFLTRTEERAREFAFSQPYFSMPYVLVARTDAPLYWDLASLRGKRLALPLQHPLRPTMARKYPEVQLLAPRDGNEAMDMVAMGDADASVEVKLFANLRINGDAAGLLRALGTVDEVSAQFHMATSPQASALMPLIDRALAEVPPGERERLERRWVAVELKPPFPWRRWAPTIAVGVAALLLLAGGTVAWARRLQREVLRRRRADEQLDDIGRTMPGVAFRYIVDAQGRIERTFFSSGAAAFFGFEPPAGRTVVDFVQPYLSPAQHAEAMRLQTEAMRGGGRFRYTAAYAHPDGRERQIHCEAVRSTTRDGQTAWTGYIVDVSAEHALQQRLAQEAQERHLMLASASHELRAPTHTLTLALQDDALRSVPATAAQPLAIARDAARSLAQLLDDVLDSARLDAGRLALRPQPFDLHALLAQVAELHRTELAHKGLSLALEIEPALPRTLQADPLRLKQVLVNLLSNAGKYTQRGGVTLRARAVGADKLTIEVQDTGIGIPAEQQAALFEPFFTVRSPGPGSPPSSGLGLSICRRLVELMGGHIQLHSEPSVGTTVTVTLPLTAATPADARPVRREGVLLLCDDDEVSRVLMAAALQRLGLPVQALGDATQALARWREGGVRGLITDLTMPGLSGLELVAAVRQAERDAAERTAIVVCSGSAPPAADEPAPPYDAFLSKPVDLGVLADTLHRLLAPA